MAPTQAPNASSLKTTLPPLMRSTTLPSVPPNVATNRTLLTPEDAMYQGSPPRKQSAAGNKLQKELRMTNGEGGEASRMPRRGRHKDKIRSASRRGKRVWSKLLWVKQSYPDNYTDQATFLEHLQRNPRLQPYDFWPLVADSTVIVQHVCSVIIFIVCFVGIFHRRIAPEAVVGWGSVATILGWVLWDWWVGQEESSKPLAPAIPPPPPSSISAGSSTSNLNGNPNLARHLRSASASSINSQALNGNPNLVRHSQSASASSINSQVLHSSPRAPNFPPPSSPMSHRTSLRLSTAKSALLIYFTLLGLSPILKSLTRSTSSDSIWAMSFMLFTINIFFFDYGTPAPSFSINTGNKNIPASLSTNAALMASTVLASRLPSTGQVFSLTLFSIEVFGLFPVFRRYARQRDWRGHVALTSFLVMGAGGGVGLILGRGGDGEGLLGFSVEERADGGVDWG
ncbi:Phosphatidylinositol N-acetylglucosaminyltransferase GPI2 subunit, partial [Lachnellula willkommii]